MTNHDTKKTEAMKRSRRTVERQGVYRHYRKGPNGELVLVGDVAYTYFERVPTQRRKESPNGFLLAARNASDLEHRERESADFESLVDAACEMEG